MPTATAKKKPATKKAAKPKAPTGTRIGHTLVDNELHALYLLPGTFKGPWAKAVEWAKKQGGELPSRIDQLVLFQRAKDEFERDWYWSGEQYAGNDACAWYQLFGYGGQNTTRKYGALRARAVRRLKI